MPLSCVAATTDARPPRPLAQTAAPPLGVPRLLRNAMSACHADLWRPRTDREQHILLDARQLAATLFPGAAAGLLDWRAALPADAWPLPAADAARARASPPRVKPIMRPTQVKPHFKQHGNSARRWRKHQPASLTIRRKSSSALTGDGAKHPVDEPKAGPKLAAASPVFQQHQETVILPMAKTNNPDKLSWQSERERAVATASVRSMNRTQVASLDGENTLLESPPPAVESEREGVRAVMIPECRQMASIEQTRQQLWIPRQQHQPLRLCLPQAQRAALGDALAAPIAPPQGRSGWLLAFPLYEPVAEELRELRIHKSDSVEQHMRVPDTTATPLGDDAVVSVLTITGLTEPAPEHGPTLAHLQLRHDSFRLVRHVGLGGHEQLLLAWCAHRQGAVGAGVLEINVNADGDHELEDPRTGFAFTAATLDELAAGLANASGCRYIDATLEDDVADAMAPAPQMADEGADEAASTGEALTTRNDGSPLSVATNLWVCAEELRSRTAPHDIAPYSAGLDFFAAADIDVPGMGTGMLMYRNTFLLLEDRLLYVTLHGLSGTLLCAPTARVSVPVMQCLTENDRLFAVNHELYEGGTCTLEDMATHLQARGMVRVAEAMLARPAATPPAVSPMLSPAVIAADAPIRTTTFAFDPVAAVLHYIDPHGHAGTLHFWKQRPPHRQFQLIPPPLAADQAFVQRNGLQTSRRYNAEEIDWMLQGNGYARVPPPE